MYLVLQNCMGLLKGEHGSITETCPMSDDAFEDISIKVEEEGGSYSEACLIFDDAHEINIKVEGDTDETGSHIETCLTYDDDARGGVKINVEEDIDEIGFYAETFLTSSDDAHGSVKIKVEEDTDELSSCTKTHLSSSADSHEVVMIEIVEGTDVKLENVPQSITFPEVKTEPQVRLEHSFVSIVLCLYMYVCLSVGGWFLCMRSHLCCEW